MQVELSAFGKFHTFDLARQLYQRGHLSQIYTGYPRFKLRNEGLPQDLISTFPYLIAPMLALRARGALPQNLAVEWEYRNTVLLGKWINTRVSKVDAFMGLSGSGLETGTRIRKAGGVYVCDRGSAHIRVQDQILREEHKIWSFPYKGIDSRIIDREEAEYETAQVITVPSDFARRSFDRLGVSKNKVRTVPYGVDLTRFQPKGVPDESKFSVLFVGRVTLQKGFPYLLEAFKNLRHPRKSLRVVGPADSGFLRQLHDRGLVPENVEFVGPVPQTKLTHYFSTSDVLVLPSVQEGLAMVMAQAMACGCPVIATENTGAENLFVDGREGFIVPIRHTQEISSRLQQLADDRAEAMRMREAALRCVSNLGGWDQYGSNISSLLTSLITSVRE